jgi:hypothetical protein
MNKANRIKNPVERANVNVNETHCCYSYCFFQESHSVLNFINILRAHFSFESAFLPKRNLKKPLLYKKRAHKMLMKLTPEETQNSNDAKAACQDNPCMPCKCCCSTDEGQQEIGFTY